MNKLRRCRWWSGMWAARVMNYWVTHKKNAWQSSVDAWTDVELTCFSPIFKVSCKYCADAYIFAYSDIMWHLYHGQQGIILRSFYQCAVCDCACVIIHSALSLTRLCLLCDWYTRQYLRTKSGNVRVFIRGRRGGPCKNICTTFCPCYGNAR